MHWLFTFLLSVAAPVALRVLAGVGITFTFYQGVDLALGVIETRVLSGINGLPADVLAILNLAGFGIALNTLFSVYATALVLRGLTASGVLARPNWRYPGSNP